MIRYISITLLIAIASLPAAAQQYLSRNTQIHFFSDAPMEKIEATNPKGVTIINVANATIQSSVLMKGFQFRKALMQQHFNETYIESDKYPKASFTGKVVNTAMQLTISGNYTWQIEGELTMHGKTNPIETKALVQIDGAIIKMSCSFNILLSDYAIAIPSLVKDNVSNRVKVDITITDVKPM